MFELAIFDTPDPWSALAVGAVRLRPDRVIDLGAGTGSLIAAAQGRWRNADLVAAEIDPERIMQLKSRVPEARTVLADLLRRPWPRQLSALVGSFDVAVGNPPFTMLQSGSDPGYWLKAAGLNDIGGRIRFRAETIFLAQNLNMLREGGQLSIVLPDGLISGRSAASLRARLFEQHRVHRIMQLPSNCFKNTEARCHIVMITKGAGPTRHVRLDDFSTDSIQSITRCADDLVERADPSFHLWKANETTAILGGLVLGDIAESIDRGSISVSDYRGRHELVHSNHIAQRHTRAIRLPESRPTGLRTAEAGDILMARVGTRCVGKVCWVQQGTSPYSDCVYRIRVPANWRSIVLSSLCGEMGRKWFSVHARGVCAKSIGKSDLLRFRVAHSMNGGFV